MQDIDGLAERMATSLKSRVARVDVVTSGGAGTDRPEALLNFRWRRHRKTLGRV